RMLPLVQRVVEDILTDRKTLNRLQPEQERLDRHRRDLVWLERRRRYQIHEEVAAAERHLHAALEELGMLGVALLEPDTGRVGFPTRVNDGQASFSWPPGETTLGWWHFAEETAGRPIPSAWWNVTGNTLAGSN